MKPLMMEEIRRMVHGRWRKTGQAISVEGVTTDTRAAKPGELFIALRGENFDGHKFLAAAAQKGCVAAIVDNRPDLDEQLLAKFPGGVIGADDTVLALGELGRNYRKLLPATVVGITGSNGKTTVKGMIHHILSRRLKGLASPKSFNNNIGVPLTLLSAGPELDYVLCEIGTNAPGEVAGLAEIAAPDVAVIVSVGPTHLEKLIDVQHVAVEKASLLGGLTQGGLAVVWADSKELDHALKAYDARTVRFGAGESADLRLTGYEPLCQDHGRDGRGTHGQDARATNRGQDSRDTRGQDARDTCGRFQINGRSWFDLAVPGRHNASNALAAIAVAQRFGFTQEEAARAMADFAGTDMRLQTIPAGAVTIINDAYNANPASLAAAGDAMASFAATRRVLVAGDMLELGSESAAMHRAAGATLARAGLDLIVGVGARGREIAAGAAAAGAAKTVEMADLAQAANELPGLLAAGDVVLLKGSRGMGMERLIDPIRAAWEQA